MGKETKIGLAVLAVLLIVFGVVVVQAAYPAGRRDGTAATPPRSPPPRQDRHAGRRLEADRHHGDGQQADGALPREDIRRRGPPLAGRRDLAMDHGDGDPPKKSSAGRRAWRPTCRLQRFPARRRRRRRRLFRILGRCAPVRAAVGLPRRRQAGPMPRPRRPPKQAADPFQGRADRYAPAAAPEACALGRRPPSAARPQAAAPTYASVAGRLVRRLHPPPGNPYSPRDRSPRRRRPVRRRRRRIPRRSQTWSLVAVAIRTLPPRRRRPTRTLRAIRYSTNWPATARGPAGTVRAAARRPAATRRTPASRAGGSYEVQPNDNYWLISQKVYGSGAYFKALAEHNRGKVAQRDKLRVGDRISTPTIAQLEQTYPELCPKPSRRESGPQPRHAGQHARRLRRRADLRGPGGRHALRHRAERTGQGDALGGNLRAEPRRPGQGFRLPHAGDAVDLAPEGRPRLDRQDHAAARVGVRSLTHDRRSAFRCESFPAGRRAWIARPWTWPSRWGFPMAAGAPAAGRPRTAAFPTATNCRRPTRPITRVRTERNVRDSDATLILCRGGPSGGTELTLRLAQQHGRPCLVVDLDAAGVARRGGRVAAGQPASGAQRGRPARKPESRHRRRRRPTSCGKCSRRWLPRTASRRIMASWPCTGSARRRERTTHRRRHTRSHAAHGQEIQAPVAGRPGAGPATGSSS